jgi:hypothetical protein
VRWGGGKPADCKRVPATFATSCRAVVCKQFAWVVVGAMNGDRHQLVDVSSLDDDDYIYRVRPCGDADSGVSHPCHTIPSSDVVGMCMVTTPSGQCLPSITYTSVLTPLTGLPHL